ncbi:DUF6094 domain-containing protein [Anaerolinea sp.]|uniref:DUF6094 domain-containing protein n=1 Tax=Anaerolinea sp. TaxID=1872519 RepID=UPI002ACE286E|nr:DUF6094 domain-containing protein [Anaerolinea sp.]
MRPEHLINLGYTPTTHAAIEKIAACLFLPTARFVGNFNLFDPCAGDGSALAQLAELLRKKVSHPSIQNVVTWGIELNPDRAEEAKKKLDNVLNADFFRTAVSHQSMSLVFLNPPYDNAGGENSVEKRMIMRSLPYLHEDGVIVLVIPDRLTQWVQEKVKARWDFLFPTEDPNSPNQMVLIGQVTNHLSQLPESNSPYPTRLPRIDSDVDVTMRVMYYTDEEIGEIVQRTPLPKFHKTSSLDGTQVLHPLRAGHRAAYLASFSGTISIADRAIRVSVKRERTVKHEINEDGKEVMVESIKPVMNIKVVNKDGISELPFEKVTEWAEQIDKAIHVKSLVDVRPDGMPIVESWEQTVLDTINSRLPEMNGKKGLLSAQAVRAVGMARALLGGQKAVYGIMEMGYGKTPISLTIRQLYAAKKGIGFTVILCPPHLVAKWVREAQRLLPSKIVLPDGNGDQRIKMVQDAIRSAKNGEDVVLVVSREAVKLDASHKPGLIPVIYPRGKTKVWGCPHCYTPAVLNAEEGWDRDKIFRWGEWVSIEESPEPPKRFLGKFCPVCKKPYGTVSSEPRRHPLANLIYRAVKKTDIHHLFLIVDEVHEYRNDTLQGAAFSRLFKVAHKAVLLTGTLFGGKASDLYNLLRWTSPIFRKESLDVKQFVQEYGYLEEVTVYEERRFYGRSVERKSVRERPGVSPTIFKFLLGMTAFGALPDVAEALPAYQESRESIVPPIIPETGSIFQKSYGGQLFHSKGHGAFSTWLRAYLGYYNIASTENGEPKAYTYSKYDQDGRLLNTEVLFTLPGYTDILPKEEKLIEILKQQKSRGRKVVILAEQTVKRSLPERLVDICKQAGVKAVYLDTAKVSASEREEWIIKNANKMDVLIAHPKAVETGLDLIMFQTVIAYEAIFNTVSLSQAIRRLYRLGQTQSVEVYALAYQGIEEEAWDLIANKIAWLQSLYGDFVPSNLGDSDDQNLDLMRALTKRIQGSEEKLPLVSGNFTLAGMTFNNIHVADPDVPVVAEVVPLQEVTTFSWDEWAKQRNVIVKPTGPKKKSPAVVQEGQLSLF